MLKIKGESTMLKKLTNNAHAVKEWWQREAHSMWKKMSCGAAMISRMRRKVHGEEWRKGQDKHHHSASHNHSHKK